MFYFSIIILILFISSTNSRMMSFHRPRISKGKHSLDEKPIVKNKHDKCECFPRTSYFDDLERGQEISMQNRRPLKEMTTYDCVCINMGSKPISNIDVIAGTIFYSLILAIIVFVNCF